MESNGRGTELKGKEEGENANVNIITTKKKE